MILIVVSFRATCTKDYFEDRYDFLVFENTESTKQMFIEEQSMIRSLHAIKDRMMHTKCDLRISNVQTHYKRKITNGTIAKLQNVNLNRFLNIPSNLTGYKRESKSKFKMRRLASASTYFDIFSDVEVMKGAKKGITTLFETYPQNISNFVKGCMFSDTSTKNCVGYLLIKMRRFL